MVTPSAIGDLPSAVLALYPTDAAGHRPLLPPPCAGQGAAGAGTGAAAGHRHAHDHCGVARDLGGDGERDFAANAIQNSVRELNFLETLLEGRPAEKNIAFGFGDHRDRLHRQLVRGAVGGGGARCAQARRASSRYGADADHIQVKRGADGLARAKRLLDATRYYSFYTLDVSDVLDYGALSASAAAATATSKPGCRTPAQRGDLLAYHRQPRRVSGFDYRPDDAALGRLVGKYWAALDAVDEPVRAHLWLQGRACPSTWS